MNFMIELKNIKKSGSIISCDAYFEDCKEPTFLRYSMKTREILPFTFPDGYGYCKTHVSFARKYFEWLGDKEPPESKLIMWY